MAKKKVKKDEKKELTLFVISPHSHPQTEKDTQVIQQRVTELEKKAKQAECPHDRIIIPVEKDGRVWRAECDRCGKFLCLPLNVSGYCRQFSVKRIFNLFVKG